MSRAAAKSRAEKGRTPTAPAPPPPPSQSPDVVDVVPGRLTRAGWLCLLRQEEGEEVVAEILEEVLSQLMDRCYEVYLQKQLVPFTASWARDSLVQILEWQFLVQDEGEGQESAPTWAEDSEPLPSTTDSWAQGCVSVIHARPPKHPSPQQIIPLGQASGLTNGKASRRSLRTGHTSTSPKSAKDRKLREPPGFKGYKLSPIPPPKSEGRKRSQLNSPRITRSPSPRYSLTLSVDEEEEDEDDEERCAHSSICSINPLTQRPLTQVLPAMPRLDPARLPRHCVWPQYEVLDVGPSKLQAGRTRATEPAVPAGQKRDKLHSAQTEALKPLTGYDVPSRPTRRSALTGAVCTSLRRRSVLDRGTSEGVFPFTGTLMLDTMKLAPGVSLKGPQGTRSSPLKGCTAQPERSTELRPIRSSLPMTLFPLEQLTAGPAPRVIPLLQGSTTVNN